MKVLVTGSAGFIGNNLVLRLLNTESPVERINHVMRKSIKIIQK